MSDITVRLRRGFGGVVPLINDEAANLIDELRKRVEGLQLAHRGRDTHEALNDEAAELIDELRKQVKALQLLSSGPYKTP